MVQPSDAPNFNVKIFGERHTATNALKAFLLQNFDTNCYYYSCLGWKHRRAPAMSEWRKIKYWETLFIFTVRDPYTWLKSMYKEPYYYHQPQIVDFPFETFLFHPFEDYENVIKMWNEKYQGYLKMAEEVPNSLIVRMEDFKDDQRLVYDKASKFLTEKPEGFTEFTRYANGAGVVDKQVPEADVTRSLTPHQYEIINSQLDPSLVKKLGYEIQSQ